MKRWMRVTIRCTAIAFVVTVLLLQSGYLAVRQIPDFYQEAMTQEVVHQDQAGEQLEKQVLDLHNDVQLEGRWQAVFTDDQVNGWLATDLVQEFPHLLPSKLRDPRVAIRHDRVRMACQYRTQRTNSVVSLDVDVFLTNQPNIVAIRIRKARAGLLPLPLKYVLNEISKAARKVDLSLRWTQTEADPVALLTIPTQRDQDNRVMVLETLQLREGEVILAGRTERTQTEEPEPELNPCRVGQSEVNVNRQR